MRIAFLFTLIAASVALFVSPARASLQSVLNGITTAPTAGTSSINVATDALSDSTDTLWAISGSGGSVSTIVIEIAGFAGSNTFGVYDAASPFTKVELFNGAADQGDQVLLSIKADGSVFVNMVDTMTDFAKNCFGYYMISPQGTFYSDTSMNADGFDHMLAVQGNGTDTIQIPTLAAGLFGLNEYAIGWEDLYGGGDGDYDDLVLLVESVNPKVPEASTIIVWSVLSLIGVAGRRRRLG
jgi:hypothetical protein